MLLAPDKIDLRSPHESNGQEDLQGEMLAKREMALNKYQTQSDIAIQKKDERVILLESEIQRLNDIILKKDQELTAKDDTLNMNSRRIAELQSKLEEECRNTAKFESEIERLKREIEKLKQSSNTIKINDETHKISTELESVFLPNLKINMTSLLSLNNPKLGWQIRYSNFAEFEKINQKQLILVAVIGMYDVGKSWFCNQLLGKEIQSFGHTNSLDFLLPLEGKSQIGLIDTPGFSKAIQINDEDLYTLIQAQKTGNSLKTAEETYFSRYKVLKSDALIIQDLKDRFIREISDVLVLVCNILSEKEQEVLYKVLRYHNRVLKARMKEAYERRREPRETVMIIVHNFRNLTEKKQVKAQIKKDLSKSFKFEKAQLFAEIRPEFKGLNRYMYKDQFGVAHLILARNGSEAGHYYNRVAFEFIRTKVLTMTRRCEADILRNFLNFANTNLPKILKQDIRLKFNKDQTAIIKDEDSQAIVLEDIKYDEFSTLSVFASTFEPKYSLEERVIEPENKKEIIIHLEVLNAAFRAIYDRSDDGFYYLMVVGEKIIEPEAKILDNNREKGEFNLKIRLSNWELKSYRKEPSDGNLSFGVIRFIFVFENHKEVEI